MPEFRNQSPHHQFESVTPSCDGTNLGGENSDPKKSEDEAGQAGDEAEKKSTGE
jgi:hypothetical protein